MFNFLFAICNNLNKKIEPNKSYIDIIYHRNDVILLINNMSLNIAFFYDDKYLCVLYGSVINKQYLLNQFLLRKDLIEAPELIVKLFHLYGRNCFKHIKGSFSGFIYEIENKNIYLFKDQLGTKPIYYYQKDKDIMISSHSTCFKGICSLNLDYIDAVLNGVPLLGLDTPFTNVKGIPAGNVLSINYKGETKNFYYYEELPREVFYKKEQEYYEHFLELLKNSIRNNIREHENIAFTLSGGLDCTLLFALAQTLSDKEFRGITFDLSQYGKANENRYIELLKKSTKNIIEYIPINDNPYSLINNVLLDEPGYYPITNAWCQIADISTNKDCSAVMSGLGGDEITLGFGYLSDITNPIEKILNQIIWTLSGVPLSFIKNNMKMENFTQKIPNYYINQKLLHPIPSSRSQYKSLRKMYNRLVSGEIGRLIFRYEQDCFEKNNITLLTPFLDIDLVKYCAALPLKIHAKPGRLKNLQRTVGKNILPKEIIKRKDKSDFFYWYISDLVYNKENILNLLKNSIWINNYNNSVDYMDIYNKFLRAVNIYDFQNSKYFASILMDFVSVELWLRNLSGEKFIDERLI